MANLTSAAVLLLALFLGGCAKPREVLRVLPLPNRVARTQLSGTFVFLKSVAEVKSPGAEFQSFAPGQHLESDRLVQFIVRENQVDVVSIDPLYKEESTAPQSQIVASFNARPVDVVRKRTADGDETHEEEETEARNIWQQRQFVRMDLLHDLADGIEKKTNTASFELPLEIDSDRGSLNFSVSRFLNDGTSLTVHYSFLRYRPSASYVQRPYPLEEQIQFGLFKTVSYLLNEFDQITENTRQVFMNRWDTTKTIVFYFAPDFPQHLKAPIQDAFNDWAQAMKNAVGDVLEPVRENTGQRLGDLRYNVIAYDDSEHSSHGILGYAPLVTNPRTGEILKADVVLYGKPLKLSIFQELFWDKSRSLPPSEEPSLVPVARLRSQVYADLSSRVTRLTDTVVKHALETYRDVRGAKDLETRIFSGVFTHEFGHALGLRHNFMGTADTETGHIGEGDSSSTVMGYGFLEGSQSTVGLYDRAAIAFAYSPNTVVRTQALARNFYYCSDEDIYTSRLPLCQMYPSGSSLSALIDFHVDRYFSHYEVNNLRLERLGFGEDNAAYEKRILSLLLPIRQSYDNAQAILHANAVDDYPTLWSLTRQRIEANGGSGSRGRKFIQVVAGDELAIGLDGPASQPKYLDRVIDLGKRDAVLRDARNAKTAAVAALRRVILDSARPDFDSKDDVRGKLHVRGVLRDKMLALSLIAVPMEHPSLSGKILSPYSVSEKVVPTLFASLLSNTSEVLDPEGGAEPYYRIRQYDIGLRKHALKLLTQEVALLGRHPEARELIRVQQAKLRDREKTAEWDKFNNSRTEFQEFYRTLMLDEISRTDLANEAGVDYSFAELSPFEQSRNRFETAFTPLDDETLMTAPVNCEMDGLKTASGLLIRNNLNVAEDYFEAMTKTSRQIQDEIFRGAAATGLNTVVAVSALDKRRDALRRYITGEQLFLREMYLAYTKDLPAK